MNRRTALKATLLTALSTVLAQAYDKKLIVNTTEVKMKDPANPTKGELKHTPEIKVGDKDAKGYSLVEVNIGQQGIIHPSTAKHWIYEIELFADGHKVSSVSLEPETSRGYLAARVDLTSVKELTANSKCNLHGMYTAMVKLS